MSRVNRLYNYEGALRTEIRKTENGSDVNKEAILRYYKQCLADGLSLARILKMIGTIRVLSVMLDKRFEKASKEDIVQLVADIEERPISPWTKHDLKVIFKQFFRWFKGKDIDETPPEVKWIKSSPNIPSTLLKKDLLTPEEVNKIIEHADGVQDKALFCVLYDSGRRTGEILGLRIGDVEFDELGARLRVDGKVGSDIVRICASAPRLATWMDNHPNRGDPESPLWIVRKGDIHQMSYASLRYRLGEAVKRAGIEKRVWAYLFRHSRITSASTSLSYAEMCHVFGWKQGSDMPQFYVHLAGDDRDRAYMKMNGMPIPDEKRERETYVLQVCSRCKKGNSPDAKYCNGCGLGLGLKSALEIDQRKESVSRKMDTISDELAKSPEVVDILLKSLMMLKAERGLHNGDLKPKIPRIE